MRLAIFDLDGTIARHDTGAPYLFGLLFRRPWRVPRALLALPAVIAFGLRLIDHGTLKSAAFRAALGGLPRATLERWTEQFVRRLLACGVFADARAAISAHARAGDHLVLLSASPDLYAPAIARGLGFHEVICTGMRWRDERLDGHLTTPNRRGPEKVRCVRELKERYPGEASAYGNAASDLAHLKLVEQGVLVNGSARARRAAARAGIRCATWR